MRRLSSGPADAALDDWAHGPEETVAARLRPGARRSRLGRLLLGWPATSLPVAPLLILGMFLGPQGIGLLAPAALTAIDPAVPVALAVLGALVGLDVTTALFANRSMMVSAGLEATATALAVAFGVAGAASFSAAPIGVSLSLLASVTGICAASSLTLPAAQSANRSAPGSRFIELGVLVPIVAGGLLLARVRQGSAAEAGSLALQACAVVMILAAAGWLLLERTSSQTERRVFALAALLLVGGAADYLSFSALLGGLVAGTLWGVMGGAARESLHRDALYALHPLIALVLLVAGARAEISIVSLGLAAVYACLRTAARLAGGAVARRSADDPTRDLPLRLLVPGVFGVAFALNAFRAIGPDMSTALSAVVAGTIVSDVMARRVQPREGTG